MFGINQAPPEALPLPFFVVVTHQLTPRGSLGAVAANRHANDMAVHLIEQFNYILHLIVLVASPVRVAMFGRDRDRVLHHGTRLYSIGRRNQAGDLLPLACKPSASVNATASASSGERPSFCRMTS